MVPSKALYNRKCSAFTTIDLMVACVLTVAMIGTATLATSRTIRMMSETRQHQMALDELSNQLDLLVNLDAESLTQAINDAAVSSDMQHSLPNAKLSIQQVEDDDGLRLVATLDWDRRIPGAPVELVAWVHSPQAKEATP